MVVFIGIEKQLPFFADEHQLGGGGAGVDTQKTLSFVAFDVGPVYLRLLVTEGELLPLLFIAEQRLQTLGFVFDLGVCFQLFLQLGDGQKRSLFAHGRPHGGKQMGVFGINHLVRPQIQCFYKCFFQFRQKVEGAAQKGHPSLYGLSAGQSRNRLIHHGLKYRGGQVATVGTVVNQGLNIGLGKNAAAGGDGIDHFGLCSRLI